MRRIGTAPEPKEGCRRQDFVKISGAGVNVASRRHRSPQDATYRSGSPGIPGLSPAAKSAGDMSHEYMEDR